ncbi:MAG: TonB-dependent receptor plug domain-containing protein [Proteobacteria bacterium]|nr:TonB-dependent receptor plug domain-containing protein [Pseudomonadota bacterium]
MAVYSSFLLRIFQKNSCLFSLLAALGFAVAPNYSLAQDALPATDQGSTVTYPASYFAKFEPFAVSDLLDRIPGINVARDGGQGGGGGPGSSQSSDRRGLGAGGDQVLINGRRIAGKENEGNDQLSRIPASQVEYIQIIRGTSGDLDVRGGGQVINIVMLEAESSSTSTYELNADRSWDGTYTPGAKLSLTGQRGALDYSVSGEREPQYQLNRSREHSVFSDGSPNERLKKETTQDSTPLTLVGNFGYEFSQQDRAHLNLQWAEDNQDTELERLIVDDKFENPVLSQQFEALPFDSETWEIGGDYEHIFSDGSRFKTLFIVNEKDDLFVRERYDGDSSDRTKTLFLSSSERTRERIVRTSYTFDVFATQSLEVGVERAQTLLDTSLQLGLLTGGESSDRFGGLSPVTDANGTVEEMRYEYFAVHNWQLNNRMSLESTLLFEDSTIKQSGDTSQSRDFDFVRPKIDYRFDITPSLQFRTTIEKDVSQLSFGDFTTSAETNRGSDDDLNQLEGNPNLVQEKSWRYDANLEYRLPNDSGVISANLFYHELEDVLEKIDVSTEEVVQSANGNIGDGERYGLKIDSSLRLGFLDQPNMLVTTGLELEDSEVTDPFTGMKRRLSRRGRGEFNIGLRHDIPSRNMNWGFNINTRFDGGNVTYDINKTEEYEGSSSYFSWVEMQGWGGLTYRFEASDQFVRCRPRDRFENRTVGDGGLRELEKACWDTGVVLALKVRGTF